jgi:hypothetical protein
MRSATKVTVQALGALMGIAGIEHGIGEILQGSRPPGGLFFPSWPDSQFFRVVGGEPAMTIVPNLLITGILAILFSLAFLVWADLLVERKNSGLVLVLLSVGMLLVGGGIFPPIFGIGIGLLATRINSPLSWWQSHLSGAQQHFFGKLWPWVFSVCVFAWLCLFPGINILGYYFGVNNPQYTVLIILITLASLLVTVFTGFAQDIERKGAIQSKCYSPHLA